MTMHQGPDLAPIERNVQRFLDAYARCLDEDRLEDWPDFFVADGLYKIVSRENIVQNLPAPLMYCYSKGMMQDRVTAIRDALTYEFVYTRHIQGSATIDVRGDTAQATASFTVYQSTEEGQTRLFCVGEYQDIIDLSETPLKFRQRLVIVDSFGIQNLIAVPL
jgi:anthranilate 1,2-dioxygenase small subunit